MRTGLTLTISAGVLAAAAGAVLLSNYDAWFKLPELRTGLTQSLVDADSAQFRGERVAAGGTVVCGEFNSKNRMGGYAGFRRFISTSGGAFAIDGEAIATWDNSTDAIVAALDAKAAALRTARATGSDAPDFRIEADVNRKLFEDLWRTHCN